MNARGAVAKPLNPTAAALLGLLEDCGALTGGELVRVAQERIGEYWNLTRSQAYRELTALAAAGYVEAGTPGARDARPYRLSDAGRDAWHRWLAETDPRESIRIGLLLLVAFGRHLPAGRLRALLDAYEQEHAARLSGYEQLDDRLAAQGADPFVRATLSFGLHYERAVLAWLSSLPEDVREA